MKKMKKENSLNNIKMYKISKNGILENDKRLLINKLALNNLFHSHTTEDKEKTHNFHKPNKTISSLKNEKKNVINSSLIIKIKKPPGKKSITPNQNIKHDKRINSHKNNKNNISTFSSNEIINEFKKYRKSLNSNKTTIGNQLINKNRSYAHLLIKPLNKKMNKEINNKNIINSFKTTATNSYKDIKSNKNINSSKDLTRISNQIKLLEKNRKNTHIIKRNKDKDKLSQTMNMTSLLNDVKKQKIKNKEQSYKIFNDNISINNNIYNDTTKKSKGYTNKNSPIRNITKFTFDNNENKNRQNCNIIPNNENIVSSNVNKINNKKNDKIEEIKKSIISISNENGNENSDDTRKESGLNLHKLFDEKTFINISKNNVINEIITNNMKIHFSKKDTYKNINNAQFEQNSIHYNDIKNNDKQKHLNYFNNLIKKNSYEQNKILNDSIKYENFSSFVDNNDFINKNYKSSKILNHFLDIQISQDRNSAQTCATGDKHYKIAKYIKQPIYNISHRFLSDEVTFRSKSNIPNKKYKFIYDIINENRSIILIDIRKILKLNDKSIFRLLSFSYDNYSSIIRSNKFIRNKIKMALKNIFQHVIDDFKLKYRNFLNVLKFSFKPKSINNNGKLNYLFNLIIECQIISKDIKKSYEIGCDYISNGKKYDNKWKFDVHKKEDIKLWICTELDSINNVNKRFSYTSQVASFSYQDIIELQFNIFSKGNAIDPISIEWIEPIISNTKPYVYQNSKYISSVPFDQLRACEVESQILFWKSNLPKDDNDIINDFKKLFEIYFKIKSITFDISKFYFFKFVTVANKKGWLKQNKFSTFDINIIDDKENIKNEIQCIYIMNTNYYKKAMDIRLGTNVTFYIVDMKR